MTAAEGDRPSGERMAAEQDDMAERLHDAWQALIDGLQSAEQRMVEQTHDLSAGERADGYRALLRALMNQLGRFEVDRASPELVPYNGRREKFFMDNPDFLYWVADIDDGRRYRLRGQVGDAKHTSITAYSAQGLADAKAAARLDHDTLNLDSEGRFDVVASRERPGAGTWLPLPEGANSIWVRGFYDDVYQDRPGSVSIEPLERGDPPPFIDAERFAHRLSRLGRGMVGAAKGMAGAAAVDLARPNQVRVWEEMQGGAVFTEPDIYYQRGAWQLEEGQALVVDIRPVECRYWNVMLYSRFLNSLDHRHRTVSLTGGRARLQDDGSVRILLAASRPCASDVETINWLDTEGRPFGIFVLRWLKPASAPELPALRVVDLDTLDLPESRP
jgi:hypothetical protein